MSSSHGNLKSRGDSRKSRKRQETGKLLQGAAPQREGPREDEPAIGNLIRSARRKLGWTQEVLAGKTNYHLKTVQNVERGITQKPATVRVFQDVLTSSLASKGEAPLLLPVPKRHRIFPSLIGSPYALLQTQKLIGRRAEWRHLSAWAGRETRGGRHYPILTLVALGGTGKSALAWEWFTSISKSPKCRFVRLIWWSFYGENAGFEAFVNSTFAFIYGNNRPDAARLSLSDREAELVKALSNGPFLMVLDGIERLMTGYSPRLDGETAKKKATPFAAALGDRRLRRTADPHVGMFLRRLAGAKNSRFLLTSRLAPADLETSTGDPVPGCLLRELPGLRGREGLDLWAALGVRGSAHKLLSLFARFENQPLLISLLAGEVAFHPPAPGDFDCWIEANRNFDPFKMPIRQVQHHVLEFAFRGLGPRVREILILITALRHRATYETLRSLYLQRRSASRSASHLDRALTELVDRGLIGWARNSNSYDMHPIVRGVTWTLVTPKTKRVTYQQLRAYFEALQPPNCDHVQAIEDIEAPVELYRALVGLGHYDEALTHFQQKLQAALLYRLNGAAEISDLMEMLFPLGLHTDPAVKINERGFVFAVLALSYDLGGRPGAAIEFYERQVALRLKEGDLANASKGLRNLSIAQRLCGKLLEAEKNARASINYAMGCETDVQLGMAVTYYGFLLATRGLIVDGKKFLALAMDLHSVKGKEQNRGVTAAYAALANLWSGNIGKALTCVNAALRIAKKRANNPRDLTRSARLRGEIAIEEGNYSAAEGQLLEAIATSRAAKLVDEEIATTVSLAQLRCRQSAWTDARSLLEDIWEMMERGPFTLLMSDAALIFAQIALAMKDRSTAEEYAAIAYRSAWGSGPPFAYDRALDRSQQMLLDLGREIPQMPSLNKIGKNALPLLDLQQLRLRARKSS